MKNVEFKILKKYFLVIRFNHHLYTNGNASRAVDEEILAMKTFGKDLVQRNGQILDASKLPS